MSEFLSRTSTSRVIMRAPAKVNLHLEVLRKREDGYHDVETILQAVELFDKVTVSRLDEGAAPDQTMQDRRQAGEGEGVAGGRHVEHDQLVLAALVGTRGAQQGEQVVEPPHLDQRRRR